MSIVVAVRVRPVDALITSHGNVVYNEDLRSTDVVGTLQFDDSHHVTFTQEAFEMLEKEKSVNSYADPGHSLQRTTPPISARGSASARGATSSRSKTPPTSARRSEGRSTAQSESNDGRSPGSRLIPVAQPSTRSHFVRPVFEFDGCLTSHVDHFCYASQQDIYSRFGAPLLENFLSGYNCCLMAYGQTGSGKTFSMLGPHLEDLAHIDAAKRQAEGLPPRPQPRGMASLGGSGGHHGNVSLMRQLRSHEERGLIFRIAEEMIAELYRREDNGKKASLQALRLATPAAERPHSDAHHPHSHSGWQDAASMMVRFELEATYYQIYRERVYCLLRPNSAENSLLQSAADDARKTVSSHRVREGASGPYVEGLTVARITQLDDIIKILEVGTRHRRVASTSQNMHSSRSHAVLSLKLRCIRSTQDSSFCSTLNLVDLAGSERSGRYGDAAARIAESSDINCSLSCLGKVIHVLSTQAKLSRRSTSPAGQAATARTSGRTADVNLSAPHSARGPASSARSGASGAVGVGRKSSAPSPAVSATAAASSTLHVPYRESVLTFLLRDSIGGNSSTTILSTVSPMLHDLGETLSTLRYASKARHIRNSPVVNTDAKSVLLVATLRDEVKQLRRHLQQSLSHQTYRDIQMQMTEKEEQLAEYEKQMVEAEERRSMWEADKIQMLEKMELLEQEASDLRDELVAVRETADKYRQKIEELTAKTDAVEAATATRKASSGHPSKIPHESGSASADVRDNAVERPPRVYSQPENGARLHAAETAAIQSKAIVYHSGGMGKQKISSSADKGEYASHSSTNSTTTTPRGGTGGVGQSEAAALTAVATSPAHLRQATDNDKAPSPRPAAAFVAGARVASSVAVGGWVLPERYQWLLQRSRSTSQDSSSDDNQKSVLVDTAPAESAQTKSRVDVTLSPPPPLSAMARARSAGEPRGSDGRSAVGSQGAVPSSAPIVDSDDEERFGLDNDSFVKAAQSAGIDVYALLKAKKREKKERRRKEGTLQRVSTASPSEMLAAKKKSEVQPAPSLPLPSASADKPSLYPPAAAPLPPPSFVKKGTQPPPLIPPIPISSSGGLLGHASANATQSATKTSALPSRVSGPHATQHGAPPKRAEEIRNDAAVERFRQRLRAESPEKPLHRPFSTSEERAARNFARALASFDQH